MTIVVPTSPYLILLLLPCYYYYGYLVKCGSRSLAVYSNELILGSACVGSEIIN